MQSNQYYLFKDRRFWPIFFTQLCGCFNDNLLKSSIIMIITYGLASENLLSVEFMILIANAVFILPYIIFAGISGQLADKYDKSLITQVLKIIEIFIVILSIYGFLKTNILILFTSLGLMGVHSTFFGPIKYSILPDQLKKYELIGANGYIEASTFIGILIGTLLGGLAVNGVYFILFLMLVVAILGALSSFYIIPGEKNLDLKLNLNIFKESINIVQYSYSRKNVFLSILGISWFWFIGGSLMSQIPILTKDVFSANQNVANLFLAIFSVGVGFGSFWCNKILSNEITTKYVFISCLGIGIFGIDLYFASSIGQYKISGDSLRGVSSFLLYDGYFFSPKLHNFRILLDLFLIAVVGGLYIVPLYASMQYFSNPTHRSRIISANNVVNAIFMVASTILISILFKIGLEVKHVILFVSILNTIVAFYIFSLLPENVIIPQYIFKQLLKFLFDKLYKVEVRGAENIAKSGKRTIIIANHISYIDPPLLRVYLDAEFDFAINTQIAELWWVKPFLKIVKGFRVDPNNPMAIKSLIKEVQKDKIIAIFPEGRISNTGSLMKVYEGPGMIADKADANILPVRIDGPQYTHFSKMGNKIKKRLFQKVIITILPPVRIKPPEYLDLSMKRRYISRRLYDIMSEMMFETTDYNKTLFQSLIDISKHYNYKPIIIQDQENLGMNYRSLLMKSFILGKLISNKTSNTEYVGVMLPNSCATAVTFFGLQAFGRIPTMINFTSGAATIISSCRTAGVSLILSSKKFVEKAGLEDLVSKISEKFKILYLEDLRQDLTLITKIKGFISSYLPQTFYNIYCKIQDQNKEAVILFTSGTEGNPKAVALSHRNIQSNRYQLSSIVHIDNNDVAFNALPMFHCFGLTAGTLLTVLGGIRTFFYPSPLHYRIIPEIIYDLGATVMFATDTFLNGYAKVAHPYDFYSLRFIFAGAEKVKADTIRLFSDKFGVRVFEGYGVTEASPVVAVNTPMYSKVGTVGRLLPKISYNLLQVEGIEKGGKLCIKGPNVMMGYIKSDNPGIIQSPNVEKFGYGWYDTGDIVDVDDDGYISIIGREKRFAKIAGEMVSLSAVEELAHLIDKENPSVCVNIPDELKGEQIILYTQSYKINREVFLQKIREKSLTELLIPREFVIINSIPVLSTGKTDYKSLEKIALTKFLNNNEGYDAK